MPCAHAGLARRDETLIVLYTFGMEVPAQDAAALRFRIEREGVIEAGPDAWPLPTNRRNAEFPALATSPL